MGKDIQGSVRPMVEIDGTEIKRIREEKGFTQLYVATVVGVTTDTISRWENRKYPAIKRENALKLAEALEVDLELIMDRLEGEKAARDEFGEEGEAIRPDKKLVSRYLWIVLLLILLAGGLLVFFISKAIDHQKPFQASAQRVLPDHAPAEALFPVVLRINIKENGGPFSLIVKEEIPEGCQAVASVPAFNTIGLRDRSLKWVSRVDTTLDIIYLVKTEDISSQNLSGFKGEIVIGGEALTREIVGDSSLDLAPFHWVDQNGDGRIDDEEILAFYDLFSEVENLDFKRDLIDEIWASRGYEWDESRKEYTILP